MRCRIGLALLLVTYLAVTLTYGLLYPVGEGPDEVAHVDLIRFVVQQGHLPQTYAEREVAGRKSDWPMLYHASVAVATSWVDLDVLPELKLNDDSLLRVLITDRISPFALVHTEDEVFPYRGIALLWHVARLLSTLISALSLVVIYHIALKVFPDDCWFALGVVAVTASIPQFHFTASVVNDDSLLGLFSALFTLVLLGTLRDPKRRSTYAWLGLWFGLAVTTKYTVGLFPILVVVVVILAIRRRALAFRQGFGRLLVFGATLLVTSAWWFIYVEWYFNSVDDLGLLSGLVKPLLASGPDATARRVASLLTGGAIKASTFVDPSAGSLWDWGVRLFQSGWFVAGQHMTITLPSGFYWGFLLLSLLALAGLIRMWFGRCRREAHLLEAPRRESQGRDRATEAWTSLGILALQIALLLPFPVLRFYVTRSPEESGQGRHILFPAAAAIGLLLTLGLSAWLPRPWRRCGKLALAGSLFVVSLVGFFGFVLPSFPPVLPVHTSVGTSDEDIPDAVQVAFGDAIELVDYHVGALNRHNALPVTLTWRSRESMGSDYLVDLTLVDEDGRLRSMWLAQPAEGRYPTRAWTPGDLVRDTVWLPLENVEPGDYQLHLNLRLPDGMRRPACEGEELSVYPNVVLANLTLPALTRQQMSRSLEAPTGEEWGFQVWKNGEPANGRPIYAYRAPIPITLASYVMDDISLVGPDGLEQQPQAQAGNVYVFLVGAKWPSGMYHLRITSAGYAVESDLPILEVEVRPRRFDIPSMSEEVQANFGDEMILLGFDLPERRVQPGGALPITAYWKAQCPMAHSYIVSHRLLNIADLQWGGGLDHVPQGYYTTLLWTPGEVVEDEYYIPIDPATPPGVYRLDIGVYDPVDGQAAHLPMVAEGKSLSVNTVTIGPIKVGGPPAGAAVSDPAPQFTRADNLGGVITLIGYDLELERKAAKLVLYWRCDAPITDDYTTFVHVIAVEGQQEAMVAQMDHPPSDGAYPTSLWDVGEIVRDAFHIVLPPETPQGNFEFAVGLYEPATGTRLPVAGSSDDSIRLTGEMPPSD